VIVELQKVAEDQQQFDSDGRCDKVLGFREELSNDQVLSSQVVRTSHLGLTLCKIPIDFST
jgi:hypothetical protein